MQLKFVPVFRRAVLALTLLSATASPARADVVLDWNTTMATTLAGQPPFPASRFAAMMHLAMFEAVNAIAGDYEPYLGALAVAPGASPDAAAATAAHRVLRTLFPAQAMSLDAALAASLAAVPDGASKDDGVAVGQAAATAILNLRVMDGSQPPRSYLPASSEPGEWQLTLGCGPNGGSFAHWGRVTPFGLTSADQFRPGAPPGLTTGKYAKDFNEVKAVGAIDGANRSQDREDVALFYARLSPVAWANSAARQIAIAQVSSLSENARAFALLNMALADAAIATFEAKYFYNTWRPETAIRRAFSDGNRKTDEDQAFVPLVVAPCFPSYPSNHATLSYSAREILERLYGPRGHDITLTTSLLPGVTLRYSTFKAVTDDVDDARVYGGIHFRFDQDAGGHLGRSIGAFVYKNLLRVAQPH